jgi:hypothetical protein
VLLEIGELDCGTEREPLPPFSLLCLVENDLRHKGNRLDRHGVRLHRAPLSARRHQ